MCSTSLSLSHTPIRTETHANQIHTYLPRKPTPTSIVGGNRQNRNNAHHHHHHHYHEMKASAYRMHEHSNTTNTEPSVEEGKK